MPISLLILFSLFAFSSMHAQENISIKINKQENVEPVQIGLNLVDRKVYFRLVNNSDEAITVYRGRFGPTGYLLKYDVKNGKWMYPTRSNKPIKWKKRSSIDKDTVVLQPNEFLDFDLSFSSKDDSGKRLKITAFISSKASPKPNEVISNDFKINP